MLYKLVNLISQRRKIMGVKRAKKESSTVQLPEVLNELVVNGMTASCLEKKYKEEGSGFRKDIVSYLESNDDGFDIELSKAIKTEHGNLTFKKRTSFDIDKDALIELVNDGTLTIETIINMAKFDAKQLTSVVGESKFKEISEEKTTEYLELRPSPDFKESVEDAFNNTAPVKEAPKAPKKVKPKKPEATVDVSLKEDDVSSSLERLKKAKKTTKKKATKKKSADADLDAILAE
jgi:hypothetical protein